ncbi:hypothetical protein OXX79_001414 [Metschnikowia pulcherrima]
MGFRQKENFLFSNKATVPFGVLEVTQIENEPFNGSLQIIEGKLYLGDRLTVFDYHQEGYLEKFSAGEYLSIDESGKLTMRSHPHLGFNVESPTGPWGEGAFTYNGESDFQLCGDNSIGFRSNCTGAFRIAIAYTEIL